MKLTEGPLIRAVRHRAVAVLGAAVLAAGVAVSTAGVAHAGTGAITGYQGLCLDDRAASTALFNPIQVYTCNGTNAQQWTVGSNSTLQVLGMCLDVNSAGTADGTTVDLYTCNNTVAQVWQPQSNGALLNPNSGKCLDDTAWGGSGTQVEIWDCNGGSNQSWTLPNGGGSSCSGYPNWVAGQYYNVGAIVRYPSNGLYYIATNANPGYDPTISTWYWSPYSCSGGGGGGGNPGGFVVSEAQFNQMFPGRNSFYTYSGLVSALSAYPQFATTGGSTVAAQEAAAFLANVDHETGGLVYINEIDQSGNYCAAESYGCPAGTFAYYGRGPMQISWNFNYYAAGQAIGQDLLDNPNLVSSNAAISWETALWYWMTGTGGSSMTSHQAMVNGAGFGATIRAINSIECNGGNTAEMQDRVNDYQNFASVLGVSPGGNLTC
jgi:predicted chitinase